MNPVEMLVESIKNVSPEQLKKHIKSLLGKIVLVEMSDQQKIEAEFRGLFASEYNTLYAVISWHRDANCTLIHCSHVKALWPEVKERENESTNE